MREIQKFIIVDCKTEKAIYGYGNKTLVFSTREIAYELAIQFFKDKEDFIVTEIKLNHTA